MTNNLQIEKESAPQYILSNTGTARKSYMLFGSSSNLDLINQKDSNNNTTLRINSESTSLDDIITITKKESGTSSGALSLYHEGNLEKLSNDLGITSGGETGMPYTITTASHTFDFTPSSIILLGGSVVNVSACAYTGTVSYTHKFQFATNSIITNGGSISFKPTSQSASDLNTYINGSTSLPSTAPYSYLDASSGYSGGYVFGYDIQLSGNTITISPYHYKVEYYSGAYSKLGKVSLMVIALK